AEPSDFYTLSLPDALPICHAAPDLPARRLGHPLPAHPRHARPARRPRRRRVGPRPRPGRPPARPGRGLPFGRLAAAARPVRRALVLRGAALVALTVALGARAIDSDVYEGGEAREALVAREMLDTGDWILPLWNGSVVPSKPPLFHWLVTGASRLAGGQVTERTLRAP